MDLHYSQTLSRPRAYSRRFTTLWIYTILKLFKNWRVEDISFTTLWIYTILKPALYAWNAGASFTTLWIYTILKRVV